MLGILPDVNIEGHVHALVKRLRRPDMVWIWDAIGVEVQTFSSLGWAHDTPDREIWRRCQNLGLVLITDNRNEDGEDSLETTLRDSVVLDSLPVLTISNKNALRTNVSYAEKIAEDLLEVMFDLKDVGRYRGAGRVFLPLPPSISPSRS